MEELQKAVKRFGRNALALGICQVLAWLTQDPRFIWLAPVLNAVAKYLREKTKSQGIPL